MIDKDIKMEVLEIRRVLRCSRERLFSALSRPELMATWLNAGPDGTAKVEADFVVGGHYRVQMLDGSGKCVSDTEGEYLQIEQGLKIVCTWVTAGFVEHSVLSFEIEDAEEGVELVLRHRLSAPLIEPHSIGWPNCLGRLQAVVEEQR